MDKQVEKIEKTTIISFISGKGGAGKTALSVSAGQILSNIGSKVLFIDSDLVTHGATFLLGFDENKEGILELYSMISDMSLEEYDKEKYYYDRETDSFYMTLNYEKVLEKKIDEYIYNNIDRIVYKIDDGYDYIQSTSIPSREYSRLVYQKGTDLSYVLKNIVQYFVRSRSYDYIIIDTQAGAVETTEMITKLSNKCIIVMEPDPVATYATENIVSEFKDSLPLDSFYLINKLSVEEAGTYRAIEQFVRMLRHLNPVPFDFGVRKAFMLRKIPIEENNPNSFMFGVVRMLKDLLSDRTSILDDYYTYLESKILKPINDKINELEIELDDLTEVEYNLKTKLVGMDDSKVNIIYRISEFIVLIITIMLLTIYGIDYLITGQGYIEIGNEFYIMIIGLILAVIVRFYGTYYKGTLIDEDEKRYLELELESIRERKNRLRSEYESYKNLMITRTTEMLLDISENKK